MAEEPADGPNPPPAPRTRPRAREEFTAHVRSTRADIERGVQATRAQFDATSERITARTGRNLILAILIGLGLGLILLASLIVVKVAFVGVAVILIGFTSFELAEALRAAGRHVPRIPTVAAAVAMMPAAYVLDGEARWLVTLGGAALIVVWRLVENLVPALRTGGSDLAKDLGAGLLVFVYVPFLASFTVLLVSEDGGQWWTLALFILVVAVDTAAYVSGLLFGKHPMAPKISPKKTWEGFAGAALVSIVGGVILAVLMLGEPWWFGPILGVVLLLTATLGDLGESLIKRDLGIKDMSTWLPGHGGFLDRLDSILPSSAAVYALFLLFH